MPGPDGSGLVVMSIHIRHEMPGLLGTPITSRDAIIKRPLGVTVVAVLMCIGAGLLVLGSLAFFALGAIAISAGVEGPMAQLFLEMGIVGAGISFALAVAYAASAILMWRLVYWARSAAIVSIAAGLFFAAVGILGSLPRPEIIVFAWGFL